MSNIDAEPSALEIISGAIWLADQHLASGDYLNADAVRAFTMDVIRAVLVDRGLLREPTVETINQNSGGLEKLLRRSP